MCAKKWTQVAGGGMVVALGLACAHWAAGNGGPFLIKYPSGDPAAKGVLAKIDPDLKPAREERLRVVKEDLKVLFIQDPLAEQRRRGKIAVPAPNESPAPGANLLDQSPPLASVSAVYTITNPTAEAIEVEFGFPILRGIYVQPFSMMPSPDAQVRLDAAPVQADLISNSMIYGLLRQRAQEVIDKALARDPELTRLLTNVRTAGYVRQRAREAVARLTTGQPPLLQAVQADASLSRLVGTGSDAADPDRAAARQALLAYLTGRMHWKEGPATLMVEYASMEPGPAPVPPLDAGRGFYWGNVGDMNRLAYANLGRLAAIGEQKTTQLFAELAAQFDPSAKTAYETIFAAWGGDVRERSVDLKTGEVRPREMSLEPKPAGATLAAAAAADPTIYARMDYINPNAGLTQGERASCEAVLKHLPVTFTFAPMNLLHYTVKFPAWSTKTLTVSYKQYAYADTRAPATWQLAYVVHPASLWKSFGPIELEVTAPAGLAVRASVPCREAGVEERDRPTDLPGVNPASARMKVSVHRATLTEKTGELFLAVEAEGWKKLAAPQPAVAAK